MFDIQCLLDKEGASELVIDVIVNTKNDRIFSEGILLGIALLEGGNAQTQVLIRSLGHVLALSSGELLARRRAWGTPRGAVAPGAGSPAGAFLGSTVLLLIWSLPRGCSL